MIDLSSASTKNVLIVDDEEDLAALIARHLRFVGYNAQTANSADEALSAMATEDYRVVISDIQMPGRPGDELLEEIKRMDGTIQVIMMSGHVRMSRLINCLSLGALDCFSKPLDMEALVGCVNNSFDRLQRWVDLMKQFRTTSTQEAR